MAEVSTPESTPDTTPDTTLESTPIVDIDSAPIIKSPISIHARKRNDFRPRNGNYSLNKSGTRKKVDNVDFESAQSSSYSQVPTDPLNGDNVIGTFELDCSLPERIIAPFIDALEDYAVELMIPDYFIGVGSRLKQLCYLQTAIQVYATSSQVKTKDVHLFYPLTKLKFLLPSLVVSLISGIGNFPAKTGLVEVRYLQNTIASLFYLSTVSIDTQDAPKDLIFSSQAFSHAKLKDKAIRYISELRKTVVRGKAPDAPAMPTICSLPPLTSIPFTDNELDVLIPNWFHDRETIISLYKTAQSELPSYTQWESNGSRFLRVAANALGITYVKCSLRSIKNDVYELVSLYESRTEKVLELKFNMTSNSVSDAGCVGQLYVLSKDNDRVVYTPTPSADSDRIFGYALVPSLDVQIDHRYAIMGSKPRKIVVNELCTPR